jgi:hypothetical protein
MSFTLSSQAAIPRASLSSETESVSVAGAAGAGEEALAVTWILGESPGSEEGGEPRPTVLTFTKEPQLMEPGSVGGVTIGMRCST